MAQLPACWLPARGCNSVIWEGRKVWRRGWRDAEPDAPAIWSGSYSEPQAAEWSRVSPEPWKRRCWRGGRGERGRQRLRGAGKQMQEADAGVGRVTSICPLLPGVLVQPPAEPCRAERTHGHRAQSPSILTGSESRVRPLHVCSQWEGCPLHQDFYSLDGNWQCCSLPFQSAEVPSHAPHRGCPLKTHVVPTSAFLQHVLASQLVLPHMLSRC